MLSSIICKIMYILSIVVFLLAGKQYFCSVYLGTGDFSPKAGYISLQVHDNGCGLDLTQHHEGLGIFGMRERAALLGGTLHIQSRPGHGTTVQALLPLPSAPGEEAKDV